MFAFRRISLIFLFLFVIFLQFTFQFLHTNNSLPSRNSFSCKKQSKCSHFSIHIDKNPFSPNISIVRSPIFAKILATIRTSSYYTNDSSSACVHIAPVDTIDRDRRSKKKHFIYFIEQRLKFFNEWSDSNKTHLIFNHYSGTWPAYRRTLDFNLPSHYILASTSLTSETYNCSSHITFPLFHSDYPSFFSNSNSILSSSRSILLSFKGKSYHDVQHHRTFFHHLNNNHDIIIRYTDDNPSDNNNEYIQLLHQSYFCLVPSGRRLNSYRFLESLQYGCIPVVTSEEEFLLPFSEIINWSKSIIIIFNSSLSLLPFQLRKINLKQRQQMQNECLQIWLKYFSSIQKIIFTLLDILRDRFEKD